MNICDTIEAIKDSLLMLLWNSNAIILYAHRHRFLGCCKGNINVIGLGRIFDCVAYHVGENLSEPITIADERLQKFFARTCASSVGSVNLALRHPCR